MTVSEKLYKNLNTLNILNSLWEKSVDKERTEDEIEEFALANLYIVEDMLDQILPEYEKLLDKDELSPSEEWLLIYYREILNHLTYYLSNVKSILSLNLPLSHNPELEKLFLNIHKIHLYLLDLTGLLPKKDKELEENIKQSLKEKEEGQIRNLDEVFKELDIWLISKLETYI